MSRYHYLTSDSKSGGKFWSIEKKEGECVTLTRFGKVNTKGSVKSKEHISEEKAEKFLDNQLRAKKKKGYVEVKGAIRQAIPDAAPTNTKKRKRKSDKTKGGKEVVKEKKSKLGKRSAPATGEADEGEEDIKQCRFLLTGTLSVSRKQMKEEIELCGGSVVSAVTKATHLLCSETDGHGTSKHTKAVKLGLPIVSEKWVRDRMKGASIASSSAHKSDAATSVPNDMNDGESRLVQGSAEDPYKITRRGDVFSCTCPAWRHQSNPVNLRTCKHIRSIRGNDAEDARVGCVASAVTVQTTKVGGAPKLLLAHKYDGKENVSGYLISEKLDGIRAFWDGKQFVSRGGNVFTGAPSWFTSKLPSDMKLDGELFVGRGQFSATSSIVRSTGEANAARWKSITYKVFDAPEVPKGFEERIRAARERIKRDHDVSWVEVIEHFPCKSVEHLAHELKRVEALGGEGLMLRKPGSKYVGSRSRTLLKVKTFHDREAKVVGYRDGQGKHATRTGSLKCELPSGKTFYVGTGLSDAQRRNPPKIGSIITFRYFELSKDGVPRFPSFLRERPGFVWPPKDSDD